MGMSDEVPDWIDLRAFLTGADDPTLFNVSFLSRPAEWHALLAGAIIAIDGSGQLAVAMFGLLVGRQMFKNSLKNVLPDNLHWRDMVREPVYAAAGYFIVRFYLVVAKGASLLPEAVVNGILAG